MKPSYSSFMLALSSGISASIEMQMKCFIVFECVTYFLFSMIMKMYWKRQIAIYS